MQQWNIWSDEHLYLMQVQQRLLESKSVDEIQLHNLIHKNQCYNFYCSGFSPVLGSKFDCECSICCIPRMESRPIRIIANNSKFNRTVWWNAKRRINIFIDIGFNTINLFICTCSNCNSYPQPGYYGHFLGNYLSFCAMMYSNTGNRTLQSKINGIIQTLQKCETAWTCIGYIYMKWYCYFLLLLFTFVYFCYFCCYFCYCCGYKSNKSKQK